jgi:hypothetical protein
MGTLSTARSKPEPYRKQNDREQNGKLSLEESTALMLKAYQEFRRL